MSGIEHDARELNLPKWARIRLDNLRQLLRDAQARADEARLATKPEDSDAIIDSYDDIPIGLGKGTTVRFLVGGESEWVDVRVRGAEVDVVTSGTMAVLPLASNHVSLWADVR